MTQPSQCDECRRTAAPFEGGLPELWREVSLIGWASMFVVCSPSCEATLRARYERPESK